VEVGGGVVAGIKNLIVWDKLNPLGGTGRGLKGGHLLCIKEKWRGYLLTHEGH